MRKSNYRENILKPPSNRNQQQNSCTRNMLYIFMYYKCYMDNRIKNRFKRKPSKKGIVKRNPLFLH